MDFNFQLPTKVYFGCGKIFKLKQLIDKHINSILIVTDKNVFEKSGARDKILGQLKDYNITIFDEVEENPSFQTIEKGTKLAQKASTDLIIAVGGGSAIDAAKAIATCSTNEGNLREYLEGLIISVDPLPVIAIPTTSGTGTEVTPYSIITDLDLGKKLCLSNPKIFPVISIIDPELTYSMPEQVIINTGVDVLTHAIEAYLSTITFPLNDLLAINAIELVLKNLKSASKKNKDAMGQMAYASMLAGLSITHASTILLHIMAYPLTVYHGIPHGRANGILLPSFMEFMKERSFSMVKVTKIMDMFNEFGGVKDYINSLSISTDLSSYGINAAEYEKFASETIIKGDIKITPAVVTKEDIITIYSNAQ